jgi:hypothetical protein
MTYNHPARDRYFNRHSFFHAKDKQWTSNSPNSNGGWLLRCATSLKGSSSQTRKNIWMVRFRGKT